MAATAKNRAEYLRRKAEGLCAWPGCPSMACDECLYCTPHREHRRAYARALYANNPARRAKVKRNKRVLLRKRRNAGLCIRCNAPARAQHCEKHIKLARLQEGRVAGPHTFCTNCRRRGHYWEDCPRVEAIDRDGIATARRPVEMPA